VSGPLRARVALVLATSALACDPLPRLDTVEAQVGEGFEYCNWTPISPDSAALFDVSEGLEIKEAVGVALTVGGYWTNPESTTLFPLYGVVAATSSAPDVVDVFSAPNNGVALLARKPGTAVITFTLAGHPGSVDAPITVTPSASFIDVEEAPLPSEGGGGGGTGGAGGGS